MTMMGAMIMVTTNQQVLYQPLLANENIIAGMTHRCFIMATTQTIYKAYQVNMTTHGMLRQYERCTHRIIFLILTIIITCSIYVITNFAASVVVLPYVFLTNIASMSVMT